MKTMGEKRFAEYLSQQGVDNFTFEQEFEGRKKRPDFAVPLLGRDHLFDVKDCEGAVDTSGYIDPYPWISEQIEQGRRKFKEFKGWPCCVVMFPAGGWSFPLKEPSCVLGAMYGNFGIAIQVRRDGKSPATTAGTPTFLEGGKMMRPNWSRPQNTTISALLTLRTIPIGRAKLHAVIGERDPIDFFFDSDEISNLEFDISEQGLGVIVWENAFAKVPLDRALFRGKYDERWGREGDALKRVFAGEGVELFEQLNDSAT